MVESKVSRLATTPTSTAEKNLLQTAWEIKLGADGKLTCQVQRTITGQDGIFFRDALGLLSEKEQREWLSQQIAQIFPQVQLISHQSHNLENRDVPLNLSYQFSASTALQEVGDLLLFPIPVRTRIPTFTQEQRVHPIVFGYPFQQIDEMKIHLPEGYAIEKLPEPVDFKNSLGQICMRLTQDGNDITYCFQIVWNAAQVPPYQYDQVVAFQQKLAAIGREHIVLKNR